jgi:hypothetical protein
MVSILPQRHAPSTSQADGGEHCGENFLVASEPLVGIAVHKDPNLRKRLQNQHLQTADYILARP